MKYLLVHLLVIISTRLLAQEKFFTKSGLIQFDATADASLEKVKATNRSVSAVLDMASGQLLFIVPIKGFEFEKALMQEHFNENYLESDQFPKAEFKGRITNQIDLSKGISKVNVTGSLTLHGQTRSIQTDGTVTKENGHILLHSVINIKLKDYEIRIPALVADKIAKSAIVTIDCTLEPFQTK